MQNDTWLDVWNNTGGEIKKHIIRLSFFQFYRYLQSEPQEIFITQSFNYSSLSQIHTQKHRVVRLWLPVVNFPRKPFGSAHIPRKTVRQWSFVRTGGTRRANLSMDVQHLFKSHRKEAECPLYLETVKDPKTLPCLHSFCLVCLDKHAHYARRQLHTAIKCPVCQASFQIPQEDTFGGLPASFHLNRLVDLLALADGGTESQQCGSCEENNTGRQ